MQIVVRNAVNADVSELKDLWHVCFPEDDAFCEFFFRRMYPLCKAYIAEVESDIAGALYVFDYNFSSGERAWYIYGVGTYVKMRGKGVAGAMINRVLQEAKDSAVDVCMLVPQDESLFEFYKKFGFCPNFYRKKHEIEKEKRCEDVRKATLQDIGEINRVYEANLSNRPYVVRTYNEWRLILDEFDDASGVYVSEDNGAISSYAACVRQGEKIIVQEAFGDNVTGILSSLDGQVIEHYTPGGDVPYGSAYAVTQRGMRLLKNKIGIYMNLMHS